MSSREMSTNSSSATDWRFPEINEVAPALSGQSTQEEVRARQMVKYYADKEKFQEKVKQREDKKRDEKHARYSYVTTGERLGFGEQRESSVTLQAAPKSLKTQGSDPKTQLKQKEEEYRKQMKARRELMQKQYDQNARSGM